MHHAEYHTEEGAELRTETTTALMAAAGMGGGTAWVQPPRREREALALEAVKLAIELGVDVNAVNDRRPHGARRRKSAEVRDGREVPRRAARGTIVTKPPDADVPDRLRDHDVTA